MDSVTLAQETHQLLLSLAAAQGIVYEASQLRPQPRLRKMASRKVQRQLQCESLAKRAYEDKQDPNHMRTNMAYQPIVQGQGLDDRKGELRYDFKFPNTEDSPSRPVSPHEEVYDFPIHTVAPDPTLPTPPSSYAASSSSSSSSLISVSEAIRRSHPDSPYYVPSSADQYSEDSSEQRRTESTLTPFIHGPKKHGLYCKLKTVVRYLLRYKEPRNKTVETCKHKFCSARCKKCDLPEIIAYLCDLRAGAMCKEHGNGGCEKCIDVIYGPSGGTQEDSPTTPTRLALKTDTCSQASIAIANHSPTPRLSASAIQVAPSLYFPSITTFLHTNSASETRTTTRASSSLFFSSPTTNPTNASTPIPSTPSSSSSSFTTWRRHTNTPTPCKNTPSPPSTSPHEVTYHTATPLRITPASPTTIHIWSPSQT